MTLLVFVIFAEEDFYVFEKIREYAKEYDIKFQLAELLPEPEFSLTSKIDELIRDSNLVLVIWSKKSQSSVWVNQEIGFARALNKRIIPFVETGVATKGFLIGLEWIEFNGDQLEMGVKELVEYLEYYRKKFFT